MHVLRGERLGVIWLGGAFLACLAVEWWNEAHPVEVQPIQIADLLFALSQMPGVEPPLAARLPLRQPTGEGTQRGGGFHPGFQHRAGFIEVYRLDAEGWVALGLTSKQAASALRYAEAIGGIRNVEQLERMRVLPDGWMDHHRSFLRFPKEERKERDRAKHPHPWSSESDADNSETISLVDINRADSLELIGVKGVGPWVATNILKARREWGGICDLRLLSAALNGWDSLATALSPAFVCSARDVTTRCPDTLSIQAWQTLPLIGKREARLLQRTVDHHPGEWLELVHHPALDSLQQRVISCYLQPCGAGKRD